MTADELLQYWGEGRTIIWNDPDPIEGNDYIVSSVDEVFRLDSTARITYNEGASEAEVPCEELELL